MSGRFLAGCFLLIMVGSLTPTTVHGQAKSSATRTGRWTQPMTPWGDPDVQGIWNNVTATPLQRSDEFKDKASLTTEEAEDFARRITERQAANEATPIEQQSAGARTGYSTLVWFETSNRLSDNRTSLLMFPESGRLPPLTPEAEKIAQQLAENRKVSPADTPEDRGPYERCITRGLPGAMMPGFYNHNYQILQTPGYVVILVEMIHDARIIPMDGRPHVNSGIKQWLGDSRGHWEGQHPRRRDHQPPRRRWEERRRLRHHRKREGHRAFHPSRRERDGLSRDRRRSGVVHAVMDRVDSDVEGQGPALRYACHEGNYGLPNILAGHRKEESDAAAAKAAAVATEQR